MLTNVGTCVAFLGKVKMVSKVLAAIYILTSKACVFLFLPMVTLDITTLQSQPSDRCIIVSLWFGFS